MEAKNQRKVVNNIKAALDQSASWAASLARSATDSIRKEYKFTFDELSTHLLPVRPNLLACEFPRRNVMHWLALRLNRDHSGSYLVVNLSGQTYDTCELQGPVMDVVMSGCVPPVDVLLRLCVSMHKWLGSSEANVLAAHGPDSREVGIGALGPVVLLFACYLSWAGLVPHPMDGLLEVCNALNIGEAAVTVWPSHRRYLSYFELLQRGRLQTAETPLVRLARLVLIQVVGDGAFRVLEVWQQDRLLFQADLNPDNPPEGEVADTTALRVGVPCRGDVVVRILRAAELSSAESLPVLELQACFHTAFIAAVGSFARFPARELDVPAGGRNGAPLPPDCAIDVFLEPLEAEDEDPREKAVAAARAAAAKTRQEGAQDAKNGAAEIATEVIAKGPVAEAQKDATQYFFLAAGDGEDENPPVPLPHVAAAARTRPPQVFAPDDVDAFFGEL